MDTTVCVIGGGISGLAIASFLALDPDEGPAIDVQLLEAAERPGGVAWSERIDGRLVERGPASWLSGEPTLDRLIALAGLQDRVLAADPGAKARWIWANDALQPVPSSPPALLSSKLLSLGGKLRLLCEPLIGRADSRREESVAEFFRRRLGAQVIDALVAPMVAGVFGADPHRLSVKAAFPKLWAMEQEHGSLLLAAIRGRKSSGPRAGLQGIEDGAGTLTRGIADLLGDRVRTGQHVKAVEARGEGWRVHTDQGYVDARAVVLASPAYAQAAALRGLDPGAARALDEIPYAPIAVCTVAWPADAFPRPPVGFGVLVSASGRRDVPVLGTIFVSSVFPSHAAPGELLLRTLVGGTPDPRGAFLDHQELGRRAHHAHARFLGSPKGTPLMTHIVQHARAIPQFRKGHLHRVAVARQLQVRHPGVFLAGNHLDGPGMRDCVKTAHTVSREVRAWLA